MLLWNGNSCMSACCSPASTMHPFCSCPSGFLCLCPSCLCTPSHPLQCFMEMLEAQNKMKGSFEVISGGLLDIDVTVFGPHGEAHYSVQRQKQGTFTVMAQTTGLYRVCFSNRMSTLTEKTVAFSLHTGDDLYQSIAKQGEEEHAGTSPWPRLGC